MFEDEIGTTSHLGAPPESYLFNVGDVVDGKYFVRSYLGQGGMGAVIRVEDLSLRQTLALKYCRPGQHRRRFAREVRAMKKIQSEYVIPIVDSNIDHEPPYLVMPLAERSVESDVAALAGDESTALEVFRQICLGVQALHEQGVIHRDLKPANVLRLNDGRMVVCDLGLALLENRDTTIITRTIAPLGTEGYLAPEQRMPDGNRNADARTDVYQLGKILYQIITGKHPRSVDLKALPPGLEHVVRRATAENPADRYQSVEKLEAALGLYRASKDPRRNPREVLERLVSKLEVAYPTSVPTKDELIQVLETLAHVGWLEHSQVIECFHRVPNRWLPTASRDHEPLLHPVLESYTTAIQKKVAIYNWSFADDVSAKMGAIYSNCEVVRTKVLALRSLMHAADELGRHAPQRKFSLFLEAIKTIDQALPVAEMLEDNATDNIKRFQKFNIELYHPAIQNAFQVMEARNVKMEREKPNKLWVPKIEADDTEDFAF